MSTQSPLTSVLPKPTERFRIAIDGAAATGKSTVAAKWAYRENFFYVDSGALYRGLTSVAIARIGNENFTSEVLSTSTKSQLAALAKEYGSMVETQNVEDYDSQHRPTLKFKLLVEGKDITSSLRQYGTVASYIAKVEAVREALKLLQRELAENKKNIIMDGRDIGTEIFPEPETLKIWVTADIETRVRRRLRDEGKEANTGATAEMLVSLLARDTRDQQRLVSPLRKADDAFELATEKFGSLDQEITALRKLKRLFIEGKSKSLPRVITPEFTRDSE